MMRSMFTISVLFFFPSAGSLANVALVQDKALQKEPEVADADIESWVRDLGSANFDEREIATQKLLDLGSRALPFLEKAVKGSKDSEVRWNAKRLMREIRESGRPAPPRVPRTPFGGERGEDRGMPMEDLLRQMERQQAEMRRMMEEHFRMFREQGQGDWDSWPFETDFDSAIEMEPFELPNFGPGSGTGSHSFSLRQSNDGVRLEIVENKDGKEQRQVFEAKNMDEFREKYPEVAEKYGLREGAAGQRFRFQIGERPRGMTIPPTPRVFRFRQQGEPPRIEGLLERSSGPRLGVEVDAIEPALASYLDIPEGVGLIVRHVAKGSLAERMGVQEKDVLVSINEKSIRGRETILAALRELEPGAEVRVEVQRAGAGKLALKGTKEKVSETRDQEKDAKPLEKEGSPK